MDWEAEYNRSKAGRPRSVADPSRRDDDDMFNDIGGEPARNDDPRGAERNIELTDGGRMRERVELLPEEELKGTPLEQMTRHWMNERHAPDLLPAQENLLAHLLDHLRRQVSFFTSWLISSD
jgi:GINS complex subunit 4